MILKIKLSKGNNRNISIKSCHENIFADKLINGHVAL